MKFTDEGIEDVTVECHYCDNSNEKAVFFDVYSDDTRARVTGFFTKQELQELIKLIEEAN